MRREIFDPDGLYTVNEIVERLKVHGDTVRAWLREGELEGVNFGGRTGWRVRGDDLNAFIRSREGNALAVV